MHSLTPTALGEGMKTNHHVPVLVTVTLLLLSTTSRAGNQTVVGLDPFFFNDSGWRWGAFLEPDAVEATNDGILFDVPVTDFGQWPGTANGGIGVGLDGLDVDFETHQLEIAYRVLDNNEANRFRVNMIENGAPDTGEEYQYLFDLNLPIGEWATAIVPMTEPSAVWTIGGDNEANAGLKQIQIQSVWNSTDVLNFEVGGIHVRPIDQTRDNVIFELNANNFRTGYVENGFDGFVTNDFRTINIDADSYGRLGMTWVSTDFDHETHDIVVRAKRGPDNTAEAFRVGFRDEDGLEGLADLSGEDFFFEFSAGDFSTDEFTAVRMPFTEFELVENFDLLSGDEEMNFGAFAVMLETIEGDFSRFNMEIESIQIVQRMPEINGDYDGNGVLDAIDIDALSEAIRSGKTDTEFDINRDGQVDDEDLSTWVVDLKMTYFGDANLDGEFNSGDLVAVFQAGEYENNEPLIASWAIGDWNGDGKFTSGDLVAAFQDGGYEQGPRLAANAVPEPASVVSLFGGLTAAIAIFRRRRGYLAVPPVRTT